MVELREHERRVLAELQFQQSGVGGGRRVIADPASLAIALGARRWEVRRDLEWLRRKGLVEEWQHGRVVLTFAGFTYDAQARATVGVEQAAQVSSLSRHGNDGTAVEGPVPARGSGLRRVEAGHPARDPAPPPDAA